MNGVSSSLQDGLIILDKGVGLTSQDAVFRVRRQLGLKKLGHTGTLDKFATGVLPLLAGSCTRLSSFLMESKKSYEALLLFGSETDTLDPEGEVIFKAPLPSLKVLEAAIPTFLGDIFQIPPEYSAIHVDGRRAHEMMRAGEKPLMKPRPVHIFSIQILEFDKDRARISVDCSKGTYIRSLARDIGRACASAAHLGQLRRTFTAGFSIAESIKLEDLKADSILPFSPDVAQRVGLGRAWLKEGKEADFKNGKKLSQDFFQRIEDPELAFHGVFRSDSTLCGVVKNTLDAPAYAAVLGGTE